MAWLGITLALRADADGWQDHEQIRRAAELAVRSERPAAAGERFAVKAAELDSRLRLPACGAPLDATVPDGARSSPRISVEVRCGSGDRWKVYVPVQVDVRRAIVVAAKALPRGKVLTADDVILTERDSAGSGYAWVTSIESAVGRTLRRSVNAGVPLVASALESTVLVRRGQQVTLEARSGPLVVRSGGVAQSDGALGQVISVANASSGKNLQGIVRSEKSVEILLR
jgi:flagella basal body P-ring formation protein FlgA